jgi:hypothetical protein
MEENTNPTPKKGNKTGLVISILAIIIIIAGALWYSLSGTNNNTSNANSVVNENVNVVTNENTNVNVNTNSSTNTNSAVDTGDWKIYANEEYGFSFKYPSEWNIELPISTINHGTYRVESKTPDSGDSPISDSLYAKVEIIPETRNEGSSDELITDIIEESCVKELEPRGKISSIVSSASVKCEGNTGSEYLDGVVITDLYVLNVNGYYGSSNLLPTVRAVQESFQIN